MPGAYGEYGLAVYSRQNKHRCLLTGCVYGRTYKEAVWEALSEWANFEPSPGNLRTFRIKLCLIVIIIIIIIIHLLGLAPAGYLAAPDNGPEGRYTGECSQVPKCARRLSRCAIEPAESPGGENLRGGKRLRLRFRKGFLVQLTYPFALNRPLVASLQLCSHFVFSSPLGVRPLPLDSPVPSLVP
jgi:hypothetical protein